MKIVIGNNIFISAFRSAGKPKAVIDRVADSLDILYITGDIIEEIERTLRKPKFDLTDADVSAVISEIEIHGKKIAVSSEHRVVNVCRDSDDNIYLKCAVAAQANYIIIGDKDLLSLKEYNGVGIVTASEYLEIVNF